MDNVNLLRPQLFSIFPNIKYISIWPSNYIFSLSAFLSLIEYTTVNKVEITCWTSTNWIKQLWASSSRTLMKTYAKKHFDIRMKYGTFDILIRIRWHFDETSQIITILEERALTSDAHRLLSSQMGITITAHLIWADEQWWFERLNPLTSGDCIQYWPISTSTINIVAKSNVR